MPPHDLEAETSVLGAILLDQAAITRVLDFLSGDDFYRENNGQIYRAALTLFREGEPIDNVTLASELEKMGVLERVGGRGHLALLQESVPTAANVEHYARIVKAKAYKRRLITAGSQVTALGFDDSLDADEAVNQAQAHVYAISDDRVGSGLERLYDLLKPAMDRIDAQMASGGGVIGISSGFHDLDRMTNGFKPADLVIIAGRPSMGKALAVDTPIPTPGGWTTMGALKVGDQVFDDQGRPCTVTGATPVQENRTCYEVLFSDGARIVADADHRWSVLTRASRRAVDARRPTVLTTREMLDSVQVGGGRLNYSVAVCGPLQYVPADLPLDPYVLGVWLGDGTARAAARCSDRGPRHFRLGDGRGWTLPRSLRLTGSVASEVRERLGAGQGGRATVAPSASPAPGGSWRRARPTAGVPGARHIPRAYQEASVDQRLALLQGLMDTDGSIDSLGHAEFVSTTRTLAEGVLELVTGLGQAPRMTVDRAQLNGTDHGPRYRVRFKPTGANARVRHRFIRAINPIASVPVRCIQVDSPSHLYLAGRACVPTHNTSFVLNVALHAAVTHQKPIAIFSLEMSKEQLVERMLCEQARIDAQRLHRGTLSDVEYERLAGALGPLGDAPVFIDDSPMLDDLTLRLKSRQARSREGIEMIVLDYLQLMHGRANSGDSNRVQEVSAISRALKSIARELRIPVVAISQLSRAPEARPDKRPILSDLRESGCLTADTRLLRADTGAPVTIEELKRTGCEGVRVWSLDADRRLVAAPLQRVFPSGTKPVFRLRLASGRTVRASANHRFLTCTGWEELSRLKVGDRLAVPRRIPPPLEPVEWHPGRLALLAHLIGDGCSMRRQPIRYTNADEENVRLVEETAGESFGVAPRRLRRRDRWHTCLPSPPIASWLDELGVYGLRSFERRVPAAVFASPDADVAWFLRHLWATDGCVADALKGPPGLCYRTSSRRLAEDVVLLLGRLGIPAKTTVGRKDDSRPGHQVWVRGADQVRLFAARAGIHGSRGLQLEALVQRLQPVRANPTVATFSFDMSGDVRREMVGTGTTTRELQRGLRMAHCGSTRHRSGPGPGRLARVAQGLGGSALLEGGLAGDDVSWDSVVEIEALGELPVYDGTVAGTHNFIADGIVAHNSIEQDADIVMFLYRDEYYNREKSEKPGIAEIIVAKHRNGPTGTIELIFRRELTRFENLERRRPEPVGSEP